MEHSVSDNVMPMSEAVEKFVKDGDTVAIANFISPLPNAAIHEIIRQGKRQLTVAIASSIAELDVLAGSGCVSKVIYAYHTRLRAGPQLTHTRSNCSGCF